jgi:hypothetical protein
MMGDDALRVSDVGEMTEAKHDFPLFFASSVCGALLQPVIPRATRLKESADFS